MRPNKRTLVLDAAEELFTTRGFSSVSMDAIAEEAGVSKTTLYSHFRTKKQLFEAIVGRELESGPSCEAAGSYAAEIPLDSQLRSMVEARFVSLFERVRFRGAQMILGEILRSPEYAQGLAAALRRHDTLLVPWLEAAAEDGRLQVPEPAVASRLFWNGILGVGFWPALIANENELGQEWPELVDEWIAIFLARYARG